MFLGQCRFGSHELIVVKVTFLDGTEGNKETEYLKHLDIAYTCLCDGNKQGAWQFNGNTLSVST